MANFERLIKGALATQDASSTEVRQLVYQSSRNALQKMIDSNRSLTLESVMEQKRQLETSIENIEAEFNPQAPMHDQIVEPEPQPEIAVAAQPIIVDEKPEELVSDSMASPPPSDMVSPVVTLPKVAGTDPLHEIQQILANTPFQAAQPEPVISVAAEQAPQPEPIVNVAPQIEPVVEPIPVQDKTMNDVLKHREEEMVQPAYYEDQKNIPLGFSERRKTQKRFFWTLIILLILGLFIWIAYIIVIGMLNGSLLGQNDNGGLKQNPDSISRQADSENYITVIETGDLSSLVMAGRGKAQIVKELNSDMIRVNSIRDALNRSEPALPILIRLKPGVLKQISGKRVTVEIFAKSGGDDSAHFAVGCEFGILTECGRKRFLAGSQPNSSVFAFQMDAVDDINQFMYLTLSTDTTSQAAITGKGDVLDIVYIRLSVDG